MGDVAPSLCWHGTQRRLSRAIRGSGFEATQEGRPYEFIGAKFLGDVFGGSQQQQVDSKFKGTLS